MDLQLEYVEAEALRPAPWNPRKIDKANLRRLGRLLDAHGFVVPVVARREDNLVVGGHQRLEANRLRSRPASRVPVIYLEGMDDASCKSLNVALNNLDAQGQFDFEALGQLVRELSECYREDCERLSELTGLREADIELLRRAGDALEPVDVLENDSEPIEDEVLVIFEIPAERFESLRGAFDAFLAKYQLNCSIRR
jgi:ParB-like chromosome segregation protein Spo0J